MMIPHKIFILSYIRSYERRMTFLNSNYFRNVTSDDDDDEDDGDDLHETPCFLQP